MTAAVVVCPHCKRIGAANCRSAADGKPQVPFFVSDGFHIETGRAAGDEVFVVCDDCDEIIVL